MPFFGSGGSSGGGGAAFFFSATHHHHHHSHSSLAGGSGGGHHHHPSPTSSTMPEAAPSQLPSSSKTGPLGRVWGKISSMSTVASSRMDSLMSGSSRSSTMDDCHVSPSSANHHHSSHHNFLLLQRPSGHQQQQHQSINSSSGSSGGGGTSCVGPGSSCSSNGRNVSGSRPGVSVGNSPSPSPGFGARGAGFVSPNGDSGCGSPAFASAPVASSNMSSSLSSPSSNGGVTAGRERWGPGGLFRSASSSVSPLLSGGRCVSSSSPPLSSHGGSGAAAPPPTTSFPPSCNNVHTSSNAPQFSPSAAAAAQVSCASFVASSCSIPRDSDPVFCSSGSTPSTLSPNSATTFPSSPSLSVLDATPASTTCCCCIAARHGEECLCNCSVAGVSQLGRGGPDAAGGGGGAATSTSSGIGVAQGPSDGVACDSGFFSPVVGGAVSAKAGNHPVSSPSSACTGTTMPTPTVVSRCNCCPTHSAFHKGLIRQQLLCAVKSELKSRDLGLSDFEIHATVGTGSFGRVCVVDVRGAPRYYPPLALKMLSKAKIVQMKQMEHVKDEKAILSGVEHPFIVHLLRSFQDERRLFMLMEYVNGGELFRHLRAKKYLPAADARFYAAEITLAFEYLHSKRVVYRDLKPENLLIDDTGHIKITDFGFAKVVEDRTFTLCGTHEYLAPETIMRRGHSTPVDWWALGILLFEMLAGFPPFFDQCPIGIYRKILSVKFEFPRWFDPASRSLIKRLLTLDPTKRYGCLKDGAEDVKSHKFFRPIDWAVCARRGLMPPFIPETTGPRDTSLFETYPESTEEKSAPIPFNQQVMYFSSF